MKLLRRSHRGRPGVRLRRSGAHLVAAVAALAVTASVLGVVSAPAQAAAPAAPSAVDDDGKLKVLLFYKDNFHASHVQARQAVRDLAGELAATAGLTLEIQETQDPAAFNATNLSTVDTLAFAQTGGVLFNAAQRTALEDYIRGGGGFMGQHYTGWSVGNSEHDENPFYLQLVGAMSEGHPENPNVRPGRVYVNDASDPLAAGLPADINRSDEWYDWVVNPAQNVHTITSNDEMSNGSEGRQGTTHPSTWCQTIDEGRSWYTGMGHEGTAYSEPFIRTLMKNGLAYTSGLLEADCSPPAKDEEGAFSAVTPWPNVPINASLTADGTVQTFGSVSSGCTDATPYDFTGNNCVVQGGQTEFDIWDPAVPRTLANVRDGVSANNTYTDLFCSMQVQDPNRRSVMTVGGDDQLGGNAPNDAAIGVTSYRKGKGMVNEAPMNYPRWYPTGTTMPNGDIVVQGGSISGGPGGAGVLTPEIYTPDAGTGWKLLTGATSALAYGDGQVAGPDENRWWYPRAFVAPTTGTLFNITGTQMYELDPAANGGLGAVTDRGRIPAAAANQGALGNPVGATSTAAMYAPGKILQVGGGTWSNGGGPAGARAAFTVDITGGTENPVVTPIAPMQYARHWPTATTLPNGEVLVTGGSRDNNGNGGYVTNAEIWNPTTGQWRTVKNPYAHARLYHSTALLLPDGRVMVGGGGAPGPRNYTDVEYYSPAYLFDGDEPAVRPTLSAPKKIGYNGTFAASASEQITRVTLMRNGSVTHGFNNDQSFQDLSFTQSGNNLTITAPQNANYAVPGAYMLVAWNAAGTPSVASMLDINPAVKLDSRTPKLVDQFEFPARPDNWIAANPANLIDVPAGNGRMAPWTVTDAVQLVRSTTASQGGFGRVGYALGLGATGSLERTLTGLDPGREYRVSFKYARDSRSAGAADGKAVVDVADLDETITATTANPSQSSGALTYLTFVDTFTASARSETLTLSAPGGAAGVMIDDLVVAAAEPGLSEPAVHYALDEGTGTTAANSGTDVSVGAATLTGTTGWGPTGVLGGAVNLPGGTNANAVDLPDNLLQNAANFTTSFWVRPDTKANWIGMFHIGDGDGDAGSFFQVQMQTQAQGNTGLAVTFKKKGSNVQERVYATPTKDVVANQWNHVTFTREGTTGILYLNGVEIARKTNFTLTMTDVGPTTNNWLGRNGYPDPAYDGLMDDVRLYESALSAGDIAALYAEGTSVRTTTAVTVTPASPSAFGEALTVAATVTGENAEPVQGTVQLVVDGTAVGDPVAVTAGAASFPALPANLSPGAHQIEVRFTPAEGWRSSTATVTHTVDRPPVGEGVPAHYTFDEGTGTVAANTGSDPSIGSATLGGTATFTPNGKYGAGVNLPGGGSGTGNQVNLPNNIEDGMTEDFTVSLWARPDALPNWVPLLQIGSSTDTFFLLQSSMENGTRGFGATFKAAGNPNQERLFLPGETDLPLNAWTHVVFTMDDNVGKIYFDGVLMATRTDYSITIGDIGVNGATTANYIGGTSWGDPRFDGLVDDFQMFGYELSADQVLEVFEGGANVAPVAVDDAYSTDEGTVLEVAAPGVLANDTDTEGATLTAAIGTQPAHGDVTLDADGSFTYTPDAAFFGTDTFTYTAKDASKTSAPATVTITVDEAELTDTTTVVTVTPGSPSAFGEDPTVKATVTAAGGATATGTVELLVDGERVGDALTLAAGTATFPALSGIDPGTHEIQVRYVPAAGFRLSSDTVTQVVSRPYDGSDVPVHYAFDEGTGTTAANTGTKPVGDASLVGTTGWTPDGQYGAGLSLPGGASTTNNHVELPDNIDEGLSDEFTVSLWAKPDALPNWVTLLQIGSSTDTFFLLQSSTQADGPTGFAATFKAAGNPAQERLTLGAGNDLPLDEWTHVVFTLEGSVGRIYFDGELQATRTDYSLDLSDIGVGGNTVANFIGGTSWPDPRFDGLVDDFQLFDYELDADLVTELYEGGPVAPDNTAPVATDDTHTTDEGVVLEVPAPGVLGNDTDAEGDDLTATVGTQPENGAVALAADGAFTYTPDAGFVGTDTFTYLAGDGELDSEPATVTITVAEVEEPEVPVTTSVTGTALTVVYGRAGTVTVSTDPATATGRVQVLNGTTVLASGTLSAGKASLAVGARSLKPGTYRVTLRYAGDAGHTAATGSVTYRVTKAKAAVKVKAPRQVKAGARAKVTVTVTAPSGVPVTGRVQVKVGKKTYSGVVRNGRVVITLAKAPRKGTIKAKVTYLGSDVLTSASKTVTIKVKPKR
ncbi:LamG-like jellyroll fold domain-containing protein [Nocardioides sp. 1609]|uniref:LamG-like jellyroll fold domain-containing protein n=1 Tax=Nocardioides sp. 1609 TaxID=2508327 RepID=UPI001ADCF9D8|nr:LamG-like jellyroll fold domain-containing protein [Nocardioides sp. 1609]